VDRRLGVIPSWSSEGDEEKDFFPIGNRTPILRSFSPWPNQYSESHVSSLEILSDVRITIAHVSGTSFGFSLFKMCISLNRRKAEVAWREVRKNRRKVCAKENHATTD
jgi:hypothetical protein